MGFYILRHWILPLSLNLPLQYKYSMYHITCIEPQLFSPQYSIKATINYKNAGFQVERMEPKTNKEIQYVPQKIGQYQTHRCMHLIYGWTGLRTALFEEHRHKGTHKIDDNTHEEHH